MGDEGCGLIRDGVIPYYVYDRGIRYRLKLKDK